MFVGRVARPPPIKFDDFQGVNVRGMRQIISIQPIQKVQGASPCISVPNATKTAEDLDTRRRPMLPYLKLESPFIQRNKIKILLRSVGGSLRSFYDTASSVIRQALSRIAVKFRSKHPRDDEWA